MHRQKVLKHPLQNSGPQKKGNKYQVIILTNKLWHSRSSSLGLELAKEPLLLLGGLEATVPKLGRGVDKLELDLLQGQTGGLLQQGLAEGDHSLLGTNAATLDHQIITLHNTIVGEATHGSDVLLRPARNTIQNWNHQKHRCFDVMISLNSLNVPTLPVPVKLCGSIMAFLASLA
jgi:hypothetical protein